MKKKPLRLREPEQERRLDRPLRLRDDEQTLKVRLKPFRDLCSLTSDEEIDLIYRARAGDARAKERLVAAHIGFLMRKAKRYARLKVLPIDDLFQEGCMGFQRAVERFNPDRGARLATYASKIVDGAMLDALDKKALMRTVPHHIRRMLNRYRETFRALTQRLGREPTRDDLAKEMKIKQHTVEVLEALSQPVTSLSASVGRDFGEAIEAEVELIDCIPDEYPDSALEEAMKKRERELLHSLLSTLPERHQFVLRTRYGLDPGDDAERTLQATADIVGISKQAIHRIEQEALQKLRELYERCRDDSTDPQEVIHMSD